MLTILKTPTYIKQFEFEIDAANSEIIITSEKGQAFKYKLPALKDLFFWLKVTKSGQSILLGSRDEQVVPPIDTVEEWARSSNNPNGGYYGLTTGYRGRFATFIPPILEHLGFAELTHLPKNNTIRAL